MYYFMGWDLRKTRVVDNGTKIDVHSSAGPNLKFKI